MQIRSPYDVGDGGPQFARKVVAHPRVTDEAHAEDSCGSGPVRSVGIVVAVGKSPLWLCDGVTRCVTASPMDSCT